ncbi:lysophospholipid acyltransferase family protein [Rhodopila sp.]|uniref:lysophospholipid acyltransferase family protein n=1 Tax=Rhodopila sp. TaxID=2480087 RepID=UPI003D0A84A2
MSPIGMRPTGMPARGTAVSPEDPIALYAPRLFRAFGWYLRWFFWRNFHAVRIARDGGLTVAADRPLIIYSNHPSWWDPALFMLLASTIVADRRGFGPMEAEALARYKLFRRLGVYGIDTASRQGAVRFMVTSLRILSQPGTALWITSEGRFTDCRTRPTRLRPGLAHLARRVPGAMIVPLAIEYTFWNERKPEALLRFGSPIEADGGRSLDIAGWNALLEQRLSETMDDLAGSAISRDPGRFRRLLSGRAGVGGVYDVGRRMAALAHLRRARLAHESDEDP